MVTQSLTLPPAVAKIWTTIQGVGNMGIAREKKTKKERENGQADPKIHMEVQGSQNSQTILKNMNKVEKLTLLNFIIYYKPKYWRQFGIGLSTDTQIMEYSGDSRNKPSCLQSIDFCQGHQNNSVGKNSLFNRWSWSNWISICKLMKLDPYLTPHTKINSTWIENLNVRVKTINSQKEA